MTTEMSKTGVVFFCSLALALCIAGTHIVDPLNGDTALFMLGAIKVHAGSVLYRDFWDIKQPGIFLFYLLAGVLFGFTYTGSFLLSLVLWIAFAVAATIALRPALSNPVLAGLIPLLTMGAYFAGIYPWEGGQLEGLLGPFVFGSLCAALAALRARGRRCYLLAAVSGVLAGLVLLAKLLLIIVIVGTLAGGIAACRPRIARRTAAALTAVFIAALLLPTLAFLVYANAHDELSLVLETWFIVPLRVAATMPGAPLSRLTASALWFAQRFTPLLILGVIGMFVGGRSDAVKPWRAGMIGWSVAGIVAIVAQRTSWWDYHFLQLVVPLGIASLFAMDAMVAALNSGAARYRKVAVATLAAALLAAAGQRAASSAKAGYLLVKTHALTSEAGRLQFQTMRNGELQRALINTRYFERGGRAPGDIYVAGNPLMYFLAGRSESVPINGWALELLLPYQRKELYDELAARRPAYIFIDDTYAPLIARTFPAVEDLLRRRYRIVALTPYGTWLKLEN